NSGCTPENARAHWVNGMMHSASNISFASALDGTSNVFMLGETRYANGYWATSGKLDSCTLQRNVAGAMEQINLYDNRGVQQTRGSTSLHTGGCHFSMSDGSVQFVIENIVLRVYQQLSQRASGLPAGGFNP